MVIVTRAYKKYKYIVFELDDGKTVKYDLSTGETIGKLGKSVKCLNEQLKGYNLQEVIDSFEDESYRKFLNFINIKFVNNSRDWRGQDIVIHRVRNIGTFLSKIKEYSRFEQYFAAGIENIEHSLYYELKDVPKFAIKLSNQYKINITNDLVSTVKKHPGLIESVLSIDCLSLLKNDIIYIVVNSWSFKSLIDNYNYNPKNLMQYVDNMVTYEGLSYSEVLQNLNDYVRMISEISKRYDKYPRNLLTTHKIVIRNFNRLKIEFEESKFKSRIKESMEYKDNKYIIVYPKCVQDIKDEAAEQHHCVASYIDRVIDGECDILFLRKKNELDKSLVTLEVRNNKVRQAKGRFNRDVDSEESIVIERYNKFLNNQCEQMEVIVC